MKRTESHLVKKLSEDVHYLENKSEMMRVQLEEILNEREISTFEGGQYRDEVREVCYSLLARGVSTRDMESIIRTILKKLGNVDVGKLPKKSVVSNMMIEYDQLAKIQVGNTILTGTNNTLHLDGTRKRFNEYSSFQVTTGDGQGLSMGFKDMPAGSANDYMTATKDLFAELAQLMLPKNSMATDVEEKQGQLLKAIKNVQSDHHVVNKNYFEQLKLYRASFLPKVLPQFHQLSADDLGHVVCMNQLFCGMHAIIGVANVCKEALKEFEHVAASELVTSGFQKRNARCFDILMELGLLGVLSITKPTEQPHYFFLWGEN